MCDVLKTNCGIFGSDDFDDRIYSAYSESLEKQSVLPILKQELQFKIQYDRLSRGEPELTLEEEVPVTYELSEEEKLKRDIRLEQNRRSAFRSRQKSKEKELKLMKRIDEYYTENKKLAKELKELKAEKKITLAKLKAHVGVCGNKKTRESLSFQLKLYKI